MNQLNDPNQSSHKGTANQLKEKKGHRGAEILIFHIVHSSMNYIGGQIYDRENNRILRWTLLGLLN